MCTPIGPVPKLRTVCDVGRLVSKLMTFGFLASLLSWSSTSISASSSSSFSAAKGEQRKRNHMWDRVRRGLPFKRRPLREPGRSPRENVYSTTERRPGRALPLPTLLRTEEASQKSCRAQSVPHAARRFPLARFLHRVAHSSRRRNQRWLLTVNSTPPCTWTALVFTL